MRTSIVWITALSAGFFAGCSSQGDGGRSAQQTTSAQADTTSDGTTEAAIQQAYQLLASNPQVGACSINVRATPSQGDPNRIEFLDLVVAGGGGSTLISAEYQVNVVDPSAFVFTQTADGVQIDAKSETNGLDGFFGGTFWDRLTFTMDSSDQVTSLHVQRWAKELIGWSSLSDAQCL